MSAYEDFDLDRSTERSWVGFQARLAEVLSMMDASEPLVVSSHDGEEDLSGYVKFIAPSNDRLVALIPGNALLPSEHRLSPAQLQQLVALGWRPPDPAAPDETATHFSYLGSQDHSERVADQAVRALREVFGVHHPVFLASDVLAEILQGGAMTLGGRSLTDLDLSAADDIAAIMPLSAAHLSQLVEAVLGGVDITAMRDEDGDFALRVGSAMVFVRVPPDACEVLVFAPVVHDVEGRSRAAEVLNDINAQARWVRFALLRDRVIVTMSILARPFVPAHLRQAIAEVCKVADGVDNLLAETLRGRTTFDDDDSYTT